MENNIIREIMDLDAAAKEVVADARAEADRLPELIEKQSEAFRAQLQESTDEKLAQSLKREEEAHQAAMAAIHSRYAEKQEALERTVKENRERWIEEVFAGVLRDTFES